MTSDRRNHHDPLQRFGPEGQRRRKRLAVLLTIALALPLGGAGIWFALAQLFG